MLSISDAFSNMRGHDNLKAASGFGPQGFLASQRATAKDAVAATEPPLIADANPLSAAQLFEASLHPAAALDTPIHATNDIPLGAMVLSHSSFDNHDQQLALIRATRSVDPDAHFVIFADFDGSPDEAERLMRRYYADVADANITLLPTHGLATGSQGSEIGQWPRDGWLVGPDGLFQPQDLRHNRQGAQLLSDASGIPVTQADFITKGGDMQIVTRDADGSQQAFFGMESIRSVARNLGENLDDGHSFHSFEARDRHLAALGHIMDGLDGLGVPMGNVMALGSGSVTYAQALAQADPRLLDMLSADARATLESLGDLPFPDDDIVDSMFGYHTDLYALTLDGTHMFVNADDIAETPALGAIMEHFGYEVVPLPAGRNEHDMFEEDRLTYMNAVVFRHGDERVLLLPTESENPDALSPRDIEAMEIINAHSGPETRIVPLGDGSAQLYVPSRFGLPRDFIDGGDFPRAMMSTSGQRCKSMVLPFELTPLPRNP